MSDFSKAVKSAFSFIPFLGDPQPCVPVIELYGVIGSGSRFQRALNLPAVEKSLEAAFSMGGAEGVILAINSPGGSPVQSRLIHDRIRQLAEEKELPVITFAEDVAASGGYMLACAADEIYADESSILGSIGVIAAGFGFPELLEKIGVERRVYMAGESKSILDPFQPEKAEDVARLKALQEEVHASFISLVKERRGDKLKEDEADLFSGAFWGGRKSADLGLIDGVQNMRAFVKERFGDEVKLRRVKPDGRRGLAKLLGGESRAPSALVEAAVSAAQKEAVWSRYGL